MREPCRHGFVPQVRACRAPNAHGGEHDLPVGALTVGKVATSRQPLLSQEAQHDPRLPPQEQTWAGREGMSAFVGSPLLFKRPPPAAPPPSPPPPPPAPLLP